MEEGFSIEDLNVDETVKQILRNMGIKYAIELEDINIREIKELNDLGEKYVRRLEEELYYLGIELDSNDENVNKYEEWRREQARLLSQSRKSEYSQDRIFTQKKNGSNTNKEERE